MRIARAWLLRNSDYAKRVTGELHKRLSVDSKQFSVKQSFLLKTNHQLPKTVLLWHCPNAKLSKRKLDEFCEAFETAPIIDTLGCIVGEIEKFHHRAIYEHNFA